MSLSLATPFLMLSLLAAVPQSGAQPQREYLMKAAFLFNFAKFVEWPAEAFEGEDSVLILGVVGDDPFGAALQSLQGKTVKGRKLAVKRFESPLHLDRCHILFIPSSVQTTPQSVLESLQGWPVLTVGEKQHFAQMGGVINFVVRKNRLRFEINLDAGKRAGLVISSQLLKLADSVVD